MNRLLLMAACMFVVSALAQADDWSDSYALEARGEYEKAAALMARHMGDGENAEFATLRYAWLNYLQGNFNDAANAYRKALDINPRSVDARLGAMLPLMAQHRWREAARHAQSVLEQAPMNYVAHMRLMACEEGMRQWEKLARHARMLAVRYPSDAGSLVYLARALAWQGQVRQAASAYRKVLLRIPKHVEALRYVRDHP